MIRKLIIAVLALAVAIQLVPYGKSHSNPPVVSEPRWNSQETRATFARACGDCHSNETRWPWYSHVAPVSWLLQNHVDYARKKFNISRWGIGEQEADEAAGNVRKRKMPLRSYLRGHPEARLTDAERVAFAAGLAATFGEEHDEDEHEHD